MGVIKGDATEARERVRAPVEAIVLMPENGRLQIKNCGGGRCVPIGTAS